MLPNLASWDHSKALVHPGEQTCGPSIPAICQALITETGTEYIQLNVPRSLRVLRVYDESWSVIEDAQNFKATGNQEKVRDEMVYP